MEVIKTLSLSASVREEETNIDLQRERDLWAEAVLLTEESAESSDDEDFLPNPELEEDSEETESVNENEDMAANHVSKRNEMDIEEVAVMAETSGVKDFGNRRIAAMLCSYEIARQRSEGRKEIDVSKLISHKKIFDARKRVRKSEIQKRNEKVKDGIDSLYFDSKINQTLEMKEIKGVTSCSQLQKGDVYAVCHDEKFITNVAVKSCAEYGCNCGKKANHVADELLAKCLELGIPVKKILCLGGDSCPTNTG